MQPETRYAYRVQAINREGASPPSDYVDADTPDAPPTAVPGQPTGLRASWRGLDSVVLTWDNPGDDSITDYQVWRRDRDNDAPGVFTAIDETTGSADATYTDTTMQPERRYNYRVQAINARGSSSLSNYVKLVPARGAGTIWLAMMQVAEIGQSDGHFYLGQSSITHAGALSPTEFEHEGPTTKVYAFGFSEDARSLRLAVNRPLPTGLALRVGGLEFAVADATSRSLPSGTGTVYAWQATGLDWAVDDEVAVYLLDSAERDDDRRRSRAPRNSDGNPDSPQVVVFLATIIAVAVGS